MPDFQFLGAGYNTLDGTPCNKVVEVARRDGTYEIHVKIRVATSTEEIHKHLGIDATLGVRMPRAEVEAKLNFARSLSSEAKTVTVLVIATKSQKAQVDEVNFKNSFLNSNPTAEDLYEQGGDSYIWEVEEGAYFYGAYQFQSKDSKETQKLKAELKGKFEAVTNIEGSLNTELNSTKTTKGMDYSFEYVSRGFKHPPPDAQNLADYANKFALANISGPVILSHQSRSYTTVPKCPKTFSRVKEYINAYKKPQPDWYPHSLAVIETQAAITQSRIQLCLDLYKFYRVEKADSKLTEKVEKLEKIRENIRKWRRAFRPDGSDGLKKPDIDLSCFSNPSPIFSLGFGKLVGRQSGGGYFCDITEDMIYDFVYPKTWRGRGAACIDHLDTTYAYRDPKELSNERRERREDVGHGISPGGRDYPQARSFKPGEIWWTGVWLNTSSDSRLKGCVSAFEVKRRPDQGNPVQWGQNSTEFSGEFVPKNAAFVGWAGRAGSYIDALQMIWVQFDEAEWDDVHFPDED